MRVLRVVLIVLVVLAWVPLAAVTVSRLLGGDRFPTTQLVLFAPVAAVGWVVALVLLLVLRSWKLALLPLVAVVLHVFWIGQPWVGALRKQTSDIGAAISVLTINTQYGGADAGRVAALVADDDVDIVAVQEMTPDFASRFDPAVRTRLPYRVIHAEAGSPGRPHRSAVIVEPLQEPEVGHGAAHRGVQRGRVQLRVADHVAGRPHAVQVAVLARPPFLTDLDLGAGKAQPASRHRVRSASYGVKPGRAGWPAARRAAGP